MAFQEGSGEQEKLGPCLQGAGGFEEVSAVDQVEVLGRTKVELLGEAAGQDLKALEKESWERCSWPET